MKTKAFLKALKFMCLQTLSVFVLLFFGFFSITATIAFITSNEGLAIALRVILVIAEIGLVVYMYFHYLQEESVKTHVKTRHGLTYKEMNGYTDLQHLFSNAGGNSTINVYNTESGNVKVVEFKTNPE